MIYVGTCDLSISKILALALKTSSTTAQLQTQSKAQR